MKLLCFPYAGGGVPSFRQMKETLGAHLTVVPVSLPGRDHLFSEPLIHDMPELIRYLTERYLQKVDEPYAIYGHSMGSLIGFELIHYMVKEKIPLPVHFFVGARGAPALNGEYEKISNLDDDCFIGKIKKFGGFSEKVFLNQELMKIVMPILRNDFRLLDNYHYFDRPPMPVPITSFLGERDCTVRGAWVKAWQQETNSAYQHITVPGNHFFLMDPHSPIFEMISSILGEKNAHQGGLAQIR